MTEVTLDGAVHGRIGGFVVTVSGSGLAGTAYKRSPGVISGPGWRSQQAQIRCLVVRPGPKVPSGHPGVRFDAKYRPCFLTDPWLGSILKKPVFQSNDSI